jgi:hypothetical protein
MKKLLGGMAIGAAVVGGVWGLVSLLSDNAQEPSALSAVKPGSNKGVLDLICELSMDLDGQLALGITANEPSRITMAQVDFEKGTGWYQGKIAISETRGGSLNVVGSKLLVSRPAMFQRFGVMINREEFTVDRKTGSFEQSIGTQDGKTIKLIKGTCAQVIKPPF